MQSVPMKIVCAYFLVLQSTKVLLCPFHCKAEKQIGSCTLEFISVPLLASYCRIKKHHKVGIPVSAGNPLHRLQVDLSNTTGYRRYHLFR